MLMTVVNCKVSRCKYTVNHITFKYRTSFLFTFDTYVDRPTP